jgi:lysophospholipase L1-like esterase
MKRIVLILAILITACSQEIPLTDAPYAAVETMPATQPPLVDETSVPNISFPPASALPPGPVTLVALGDSLTQGDGDDTGRGYTGRLLDMINEIRPGSSLSNLGQSGWNSDALINGDQGIAGQLGRAVDELNTAKSQGRAAVALIWIGSNDLWYLYEYGGDGSDEGDSQDAVHFAGNMDLILTSLRSTGAQVLIALLDDQSKRPVALKGEAFTSITADELGRMSLQASRYNEIISEKAAQYGALTVDFYSTDIFTNPATLYDDGNHPNSAGYDIVSQKWFDVLSALLN